MRTTLTLDDDNAVRLKRVRKERNLSLKDVVNDAIRRGLGEMEVPPKKREPFRTSVFDPGQPRLPIDNIGDILEVLDELDFPRNTSK
jgi:hypothetical protein